MLAQGMWMLQKSKSGLGKSGARGQGCGSCVSCVKCLRGLGSRGSLGSRKKACRLTSLGFRVHKL